MKKLDGGKRRSPAKDIAAVAVMTALLIGGQFVLSPVAGVEVVTVLLAAFSFSYGVRAGVLAATAFALLRCFIFGFYPSVIVLYLIYYPLFALIFGLLGRVKEQTYLRFPLWAALLVNVAIVAVGVGCAVCAATNIIKISRLAAAMVKTLLWVIFALCCALIAVFDCVFALQRRGNLKSGNMLMVAVAAAVAAACTICFTLLDDVITPLFMGWGVFSATSATYFYASFLAMAPQTVCAIVTVSTLFLPLVTIFKRASKM